MQSFVHLMYLQVSSYSHVLYFESRYRYPSKKAKQTFAYLNQELKDTFKSINPLESLSDETTEAERRNSIVTYEEKRQNNYEVSI